MSDEVVQQNKEAVAADDAVPVEVKAAVTEVEGEKVAHDEPVVPVADGGVTAPIDGGEDTAATLDATTVLCKLDAYAVEMQKVMVEIAELRKSFDGKLKYDAKKDEIIDRQHRELEAFKGGLVEKVSMQIINDVIFEVDSTDKLCAHYQGAEFSEENYKKMLKIFNGFSLSLCDILEKYGVTGYRSEVGSKFNPKRQRALKTTETGDAALDKSVKVSLRSGFEKAESIVRPEMVDLYIFKASAEPASGQGTPVEMQSQDAPPQEAEKSNNDGTVN